MKKINVIYPSFVLFFLLFLGINSVNAVDSCCGYYKVGTEDTIAGLNMVSGQCLNIPGYNYDPIDGEEDCNEVLALNNEDFTNTLQKYTETEAKLNQLKANYCCVPKEISPGASCKEPSIKPNGVVIAMSGNEFAKLDDAITCLPSSGFDLYPSVCSSVKDKCVETAKSYCLCTFDKKNCASNGPFTSLDDCEKIKAGGNGEVKYECVVNTTFSSDCTVIPNAVGPEQPKKIGEQGATESNLLGSVEDIGKLNQLKYTDIQSLLGGFLKAVMGIIGSIALIMIVYGGFLAMTSAGEAEKITKGVHILIWSTLGLVVIFASYAIVDLVFEAFR